MKRRHKRLVFIGIVLSALAISSGLVLRAFRDNLVFFLTPSQVATKQAAAGRVIRLGGLVQDGSLDRGTDGLTFRFRVTDTIKTIPVIYRGMLPDLFKEGRGCVVQGRVRADGVFRCRPGPGKARRKLYAA